VNLEVDGRAAIQSLHALRAAIDAAVIETERAVLDATTEHARRTTLFNDRTTVTRSSIRSVVTSFGEGFVEAGGAARYLEHGTRPHEIWARNALALRFEISGTIFFRRMVRHPGTAPRPFMQEARDFGETVAAYGADFYLERAIKAHP
jgi:hypothetical protein